MFHQRSILHKIRLYTFPNKKSKPLIAYLRHNLREVLALLHKKNCENISFSAWCYTHKGCNEHGKCTDTSRRESYTCECTTEYEGEFCTSRKGNFV